RNGSIGWRKLMAHYKEQILAWDFFTLETIWLQTIYVLFFIELGSRRVYFAGITTNPNEIWITQQARQLVWELSDREKPLRFLIHDNDCSFSKAFDAVFESEGLHVINTPYRAPNANAFAERWVRTAREECLDHILILNAAHLQRVIIEFTDDYNVSRPHQGIEQQTPIPQKHSICNGLIQKRKVLGGIINDYYRSPNRTSLSTT
ncbi:MAG: integrase core domain-containing protein, partial [Anaerolineales bacterium]|nr:integrase core domain-containing protein [Anaerolineales bacterium]